MDANDLTPAREYREPLIESVRYGTFLNNITLEVRYSDSTGWEGSFEADVMDLNDAFRVAIKSALDFGALNCLPKMDLDLCEKVKAEVQEREAIERRFAARWNPTAI